MLLFYNLEILLKKTYKSLRRFCYSCVYVDMKSAQTTIIYIKKINGIAYLKFGYLSSGIISVNKGDFLMLKLENDEIIKLPAFFYSIAEGTYFDTFKTTIWVLETSYLLTDEIQENLKSSNLYKFRLYTTKGYIEREIKKKNSGALIETLDCLDKIKHNN